jgi:hypothetical protein
MSGAFTQAQVDALTAAIGQGVTRVEYDGKIVSYASIDDMLKLRDRMLREVAAAGDTPRPPLCRPSIFLGR